MADFVVPETHYARSGDMNIAYQVIGSGVAARVLGQSSADEVVVSRVVTDLVAGAGLKFAERGVFGLKGIPGSWDLFAAIH